MKSIRSQIMVLFSAFALNAEAAIVNKALVPDPEGDGVEQWSALTADPNFYFRSTTGGTCYFTHANDAATPGTDADVTMRLYALESGVYVLKKTESNADGSRTLSYGCLADVNYKLECDIPWNWFQFRLDFNLPRQSSTTLTLDANGDYSSGYIWIDNRLHGHYFKYTAPGTGSLVVEADSHDAYVGFDTDLFLYSSNGSLIDDDTGGYNDGNITINVTSGQDYYLLIRSDIGGTHREDGYFRLLINGPSAPTYTISLSASPSTWGSVAGAGTFAAGSSRTVTASASSGSAFRNWTEDGTVVSTSLNYTFALNNNRTLTANFNATLWVRSRNGGTIMDGVTITSSTGDGGTTQYSRSLAPGSTVSLTCHRSDQNVPPAVASKCTTLRVQFPISMDIARLQ